jgi:hypothetical protein
MSYFKEEEREGLEMSMMEDIGALFVCSYPYNVVFYFWYHPQSDWGRFAYLEELGARLIEGSRIAVEHSMRLCCTSDIIFR